MKLDIDFRRCVDRPKFKSDNAIEHAPVHAGLLGPFSSLMGSSFGGPLPAAQYDTSQNEPPSRATTPAKMEQNMRRLDSRYHTLPKRRSKH